MADSIIERNRQLHEEIDRTSIEAVKELCTAGRSHREKIHGEHRVMHMAERISQCSRELTEFYNDLDGSREAEIKAVSGPNEFSEFYTRLQIIRDKHRAQHRSIVEPMRLDFASVEDSINGDMTGQALVKFSGEEGHGRYLDLHTLYDTYLNLRFVEEKLDYTEYVSTFDRLFSIDRKNKKKAYRRYITELLDYLKSFHLRSKPFVDVEADLAKAEAEFEGPWSEGTFPGWTPEASENDSSDQNDVEDGPLDLSSYASAQELCKAVGLDRLKTALQAIGLKCGGTAEQRAERLFSVKNKPREQWSKKILAAPAKKTTVSATSGGDVATASNADDAKATALLEAKVYRMVELLGEARQLTRENVERKQARNIDEMQDEENDANNGDNMDEDDDDNENMGDNDDKIPYNPKGLPLGWDGKPIPYWLYKLHGLNVRYSCEICGNFVYRGPKAMQQHFKEWRHAHGMRCLGIPNTLHFTNVTRIEDAKALWEKLKEKKVAESFQAADEEEYEDSQGNVVNKKTYEDLRRQGLL